MDLTSRGMLQYIPAAPQGVCPQGNFMQGLQCQGDRCSRVGVGCDGFIDSQGQQYSWNTPMWTHIFGTDRGNGYAQCPPGAAVIGSKCYGDNCNGLALACATFTSTPNNIPVVGNAAPLCRWSEVFSDQMSCASGEVVRGAQCGGLECRMKRLLCCRVMRSSNVVEGGNSAPLAVNPTTMSPGGIAEPVLPGGIPGGLPEQGPIGGMPEPGVLPIGGMPEPEMPQVMPMSHGYNYRPMPEVSPEHEPMMPGGEPMPEGGMPMGEPNQVLGENQPMMPVQGYGFRPAVSPMHEPMPEGGMPMGFGEPMPEGGMPEGGMPMGAGEPMPEGGMPMGAGEPMPEGGMPEGGMPMGAGEPMPEGGMPMGEPNQVLGENQPMMPVQGYGFRPTVAPMNEPMPEGGMPEGGMPEGGMPGGPMGEPNQVLGENQPMMPGGEPMPEGGMPEGGMPGSGEPMPEGGMPGGPMGEPNQVLGENQPMMPGGPMGMGEPGGMMPKCRKVIRRKCRRRPRMGFPMGMQEPMGEPEMPSPEAEPGMGMAAPVPGMGMEASPLKKQARLTNSPIHKKEL